MQNWLFIHLQQLKDSVCSARPCHVLAEDQDPEGKDNIDHSATCCGFQYGPREANRYIQYYDDTPFVTEAAMYRCLICRNGGKKDQTPFKAEPICAHYRNTHDIRLYTGNTTTNFVEKFSTARVSKALGRPVTEAEFSIAVQVRENNQRQIKSVFAWFSLHPRPGLHDDGTVRARVRERAHRMYHDNGFRRSVINHVMRYLTHFLPNIQAWHPNTTPDELKHGDFEMTRCFNMQAVKPLRGYRSKESFPYYYGHPRTSQNFEGKKHVAQLGTWQAFAANMLTEDDFTAVLLKDKGAVHTCHQSLCFRPGHVIVASTSVNMLL